VGPSFWKRMTESIASRTSSAFPYFSRHGETLPNTNLYASKRKQYIRVPVRCLTCFAPGGLGSSGRNSCAISVPSSLAAYQLYHCLQPIFYRTAYLFIFRFPNIIPFADLEPCCLPALSPFAIDHLSDLYLFVFRLYKAVAFADLVVQLLVSISHFRDFCNFLAKSSLPE